MLTQRKNQKKPQWEALISVSGSPSICPLTLMKHYVAITAKHVPAGSLLLRQLKPPYAPLANNTVGSITKNCLLSLGVNTTFWGPHSTRGAGVQLYKKLGLSSEEVCEVGKWKNVNAFTAHYSRLGASTKAGEKINHLVHKVSPMQRAESDWSSTPGTQNQGGMDQEDEAQSIGEPTPPPFVDLSGGLSDSAPLLATPKQIIGSGMAAPSEPSLPPPLEGFAFHPGLVQDMASSSSALTVPSSPLAKVPTRYVSLPKRQREPGDSPPRKFHFAQDRAKGKLEKD